MTLEQLRTLLAIVEAGSLSAAARRLRISQPAVTKQVQRLEQELEAPLLARGPQRRAELTPAGEELAAFARDVLRGYEALQARLALLRGADRGRLAVAASTIPGEYLLPSLLAAFYRQWPHIEVRVTIADSSEVGARVLAGEADAGFVGAPLDRPGLRLERLVSDEIVLVVPSHHPFAGRERVGLGELRGQPLVMREEGSGTRRSLEATLAAHGLDLPRENVVLTLGSTHAVLQAVQAGLGLGFISARAAAPQQADGHLALTRLEGVDLTRDLYLAYLPRRLEDPIVALFVAFTRERLGDTTADLEANGFGGKRPPRDL